jgi:hypothetical protein
VACVDVSCIGVHRTLLHKTHQHMEKELDKFGSKTSIADVCIQISTYNINSGISVNFIQEYVSIILSIGSTFSKWPHSVRFHH